MQSYDRTMIEVLKWTEYNPRMDSKKPTWFRLENCIATSASFFDLDCEQKWLWVVILSLVSQANGKAILWNSDYIRSITGIKPDKQFKTIEIFEKFARLRVSREVTSRDSPATDGRTDGRDGRTEGGSEVSASLETLATISDEKLKSILLKRSIALKHWESWLSAYPDEKWVCSEIYKASAWEISNPSHKKKNFAAFIARWLAKGWDTRPRTQQVGVAGILSPLADSTHPCEDCDKGLIRSRNISSGSSEWCACSCSFGRSRGSNYPRFDKNRFERMT